MLSCAISSRQGMSADGVPGSGPVPLGAASALRHRRGRAARICLRSARAGSTCRPTDRLLGLALSFIIDVHIFVFQLIFLINIIYALEQQYFQSFNNLLSIFHSEYD
ncbi:hypothetical protein EVAR_17262_1 [Eumeta japonica]|uniref:Uncharacterized protein n=1 Tax=Eumeta variegata TaxID=151549 RepID=A0A4C1TTJ5_EUMVA|nr:hypothetical protein EVAR_17262_1 [Eumeta japonica]